MRTLLLAYLHNLYIYFSRCTKLFLWLKRYFFAGVHYYTRTLSAEEADIESPLNEVSLFFNQ